MLEKLIDIIVNNCDGIQAEDITESTDLIADLGLTSLDIVNCISEAEEAFGVEIPDEKLENIRTVGDILQLF